jgi:AraC-like DNA-binding protein
MSRIGPVMGLPAVVAQLRVDPAEFLAEFGLDPAFFDEPEHTLPMATLAVILGRGAERTGCDHLGLLVGKRAGLSSFGTIGFLMQSAPTVGASIGLLHRYFQLQSRGAEVHAENDGRFVTLTYTMLDRSIGHIEQVDSAAVAVGVNILRALTQSDWTPHAVQFAYSKPRDVAPYRQFFRMLPRFDADRSGMVFPSRLLERPVPSADPLLYRMMEDRAHEMLAGGNDDVSGHVKRLLRHLVTTGACSAQRTAKAMGMHVRTLNRALAAEGTTFLRLREEIRFQEACRLLQNTRMRAGEVAATLGYADASSFTRAFRRWSGHGPARWRVSGGRSATHA